MTAEDSIYIPFPGTALRQTGTISTVNLVESYDTSVRGCNNICPCRLWINCSYHNKMKWRKSRGDEDEHMKTIWEYYNSVFRIAYDMPIVNMNG